jgi:hypothetical protein
MYDVEAGRVDFLEEIRAESRAVAAETVDRQVSHAASE